MAAPRIGPVGKIDALERQAERAFHWIVAPAVPDGVALPLIGGSMIRASLREIEGRMAAGEIALAWYLHRAVAPLYRNVIRGLDYASRLPSERVVASVSLGPTLRHVSPDPSDPIHLATKRATDRGTVVVMAMGNWGRADGSRDGAVNPWTLPDWVIGVGATDAAGVDLLPSSSRGDGARRETWPDLVAPGWSALDPSLEGTSFAVPRVVEAVSRILAVTGEAAGAGGFRIEVPHDARDFQRARLGARLAGRRLLETDLFTLHIHALPLTMETIRQALRDVAWPLSHLGGHEVGAGVLDEARLTRAFGPSRAMEGRIVPIKVL